jgi:hypothetical protein
MYAFVHQTEKAQIRPAQPRVDGGRSDRGRVHPRDGTLSAADWRGTGAAMNQSFGAAGV